ncbi:hypothetical protein CEXT_52401 [Caerostris extrusa]|uniref:Uncharacterized protein n=1 Tax=Caerostris extrusa TaxID=172846 RepID=A0AAV4RT40_CAEEX|nr:hypothetical protein CEXT_52401 [Caerostris extrusa]
MVGIDRVQKNEIDSNSEQNTNKHCFPCTPSLLVVVQCLNKVVVKKTYKTNSVVSETFTALHCIWLREEKSRVSSSRTRFLWMETFKQQTFLYLHYTSNAIRLIHAS